VGCAARAATIAPHSSGLPDMYQCPVLSCKKNSARPGASAASKRGEEQHRIAVHLLADHHEIM